MPDYDDDIYDADAIHSLVALTTKLEGTVDTLRRALKATDDGKSIRMAIADVGEVLDELEDEAEME